MNKLTSAEAILEWAGELSELEQRGGPWMEYQVKVFTPDTATAEHLAYCVKVTAIVERDAKIYDPENGYCRLHDVLAEAAQNKGAK